MGGSNTKLQHFLGAVAQDDAEAVRQALEEDCCLLNSRGEGGRAALHVAVCNGSLNALNVLLKRKQLVDVSMTTVAKETPLILSASHGQEEAGLQLLTHTSADDLRVCAADGRGWQALHYAAQRGMLRLATALLEGGADVEARDGKLKLTPLMIACQSSSADVVNVLLKRGAQPASVDVAHMTALHHACIASATDCVKLLLTQPGLALDTQDLSHCTALLYCVKNNNRDLEKLLVSHGASLTAALDSGFSDLCYHTLQDNHSS